LAMQQQGRAVRRPDLPIGVRALAGADSQDHPVQGEPPKPARRFDHARIAQKLRQEAAHRRRRGGVGRAEIDQQHAEAFRRAMAVLGGAEVLHGGTLRKITRFSEGNRYFLSLYIVGTACARPALARDARATGLVRALDIDRELSGAGSSNRLAVLLVFLVLCVAACCCASLRPPANRSERGSPRLPPSPGPLRSDRWPIRLSVTSRSTGPRRALWRAAGHVPGSGG